MHTRVQTQRSVMETYDTERRNLRARTGEGRGIFGTCHVDMSLLFFVYVPTLVYSGVAGRPREEARRDISLNARSRDDLEAES